MGAIEIDRIARRYQALCELVPLAPITTKSEYDSAVECLNRLLDAGGADQAHVLSGLVEALGEMIHSYEKRRRALTEAEPREVLRFLMNEQGLKQCDLGDIASQGTISDILSGRRQISKSLAKKLAARFQVQAAAFV